MNKINTTEIGKMNRVINCNEALALLNTQRVKLWSWGAHAFTNIDNKFLRFKINANRHKGHVYLCVNGSDLFDVYLTSTHGNIKKEMKDIFFEDLVDIIDNEIERVKSYSF